MPETETRDPAARPDAPAPSGWTGMPPEVHRQLEAEHTRRDESAVERQRKAMIGYVVTGALTFAILQVGFGLPGSLMPLHLLGILFTSCLFGAPIGFLIGRARGGVVKGALISAAVFTAMNVVISWISGDPLGLGGCILLAAAGLLPGGVIGLHVENAE